MTQHARFDRPARLFLLAGLAFPWMLVALPEAAGAFPGAQPEAGSATPTPFGPPTLEAPPSEAATSPAEPSSTATPPPGAEPAWPTVALTPELLPTDAPTFETAPSSSPSPAAWPTETPSLEPSSSPSPSPAVWPTEAPTLEPTSSSPPSPTVSASVSSLPTTPPTVATASPPLPTETESAPSATPSPTPSQTPSPTPSPGPPAATRFPTGSVLINEVAWSGTTASSFDEWIELHNPGPSPIDLAGWKLTDGGDLNLALRGSLPAYGFFLLERTDDTSVADVPADLIYTGGLDNAGETLQLKDPSGAVVDSANGDGGAWPAGEAKTHASMERRGGVDAAGNWASFSGLGGNGRDAAGNPILGTPRQPNSVDRPTPTAAEASPTPSLTPTPTASATPSPTPPPPGPYPVGSIVINEVAWAGTAASSSDEWIELHNPGASPIDLTGWELGDGGDLNLALKGGISGGGYFLLERGDDQTIADVAADQTYTGGLNNAGETLWLRDATGAVVDTANADGGSWPAGDASARRSMERRGGADAAGNWATFTGYGGNGHDASGNPIAGTPHAPNSWLFPTPIPTGIPSRLLINEVLIRPHYDWEGAGGVTTADEFIELYNAGDVSVNLRGWSLDDIAGGGSRPFALPSKVIKPGKYAVFFRSHTHIALNDGGDHVRLLAPDGRVIDEIAYLRVRAYNLSYGRLPDGSHHLRYGLWPTPGGRNELFMEPRPPTPQAPALACRGGGLHPLLPRHSRHPAWLRWLASQGQIACR